jgi:hypothetical protein
MPVEKAETFGSHFWGKEKKRKRKKRKKACLLPILRLISS